MTITSHHMCHVLPSWLTPVIIHGQAYGWRQWRENLEAQEWRRKFWFQNVQLFFWERKNPIALPCSKRNPVLGKIVAFLKMLLPLSHDGPSNEIFLVWFCITKWQKDSQIGIGFYGSLRPLQRAKCAFRLSLCHLLRSSVGSSCISRVWKKLSGWLTARAKKGKSSRSKILMKTRVCRLRLQKGN